ncbi:hypothetical protein BDK51DRAFT_37643, partial [Blyttiomyces helicus]
MAQNRRHVLPAPKSDGDIRMHTVPNDAMKPCDRPQPMSNYLHKLGPALAAVYRDHPNARPQGFDPTMAADRALLERLPARYRLFELARCEGKRRDVYLRGHPRFVGGYVGRGDGGHHYRSPMEFIPHLEWLAKRGCSGEPCACKPCRLKPRRRAERRALKPRNKAPVALEPVGSPAVVVAARTLVAMSGSGLFETTGEDDVVAGEEHGEKEEERRRVSVNLDWETSSGSTSSASGDEESTSSSSGSESSSDSGSAAPSPSPKLTTRDERIQAILDSPEFASPSPPPPTMPQVQPFNTDEELLRLVLELPGMRDAPIRSLPPWAIGLFGKQTAAACDEPAQVESPAAMSPDSPLRETSTPACKLVSEIEFASPVALPES